MRVRLVTVGLVVLALLEVATVTAGEDGKRAAGIVRVERSAEGEVQEIWLNLKESRLQYRLEIEEERLAADVASWEGNRAIVEGRRVKRDGVRTIHVTKATPATASAEQEADER